MKTPSTQVFHYTLKHMEAVHSMAEVLAKHLPSSHRYVLAIHELLINAIEHGNLEIGFDHKTQLLNEGRLAHEIARRSAMPQYAIRQVRVKVERSSQECSLTIIDDGKGFTPAHYMHHKPDPGLPNGRGLYIAQSARFDSLSFNDVGNMVRCVVNLGLGFK